MTMSMTKKIAQLLLALGVITVFSANTDSTNIIYWSSSRPLSWSDFKGIPDTKYNGISAITSSGILHYKGCEKGLISYKVKAYFEKYESWVKTEALTGHHLEHEQLHFDITEIYARKLRKALANKQFRCGQEVQLEKFVDDFLKDWRNEQDKFDYHTKHSLDSEQQHEWFDKIAAELASLEEYAE